MIPIDDIRPLIAALEERLTRPIRFLIIDDEPLCRKLFAMATPGCEVRPADDGKQGMEILRENPDYFDCVVVDERLPGKPGHLVIKEICDLWPDMFTAWSTDLLSITAEINKGVGDIGLVWTLPKPVRFAGIQKLLYFIQERRAVR